MDDYNFDKFDDILKSIENESEESNKITQQDIEEIEKINLVKFITILLTGIPIIFIYLLTLIFSNSLIVKLGLNVLNIIRNISIISLIVLEAINIFNYFKNRYYISQYKLNHNMVKTEVKPIKLENLKESSNIKQDLIEIKKCLPKNDEGNKSKEIIDKCLKNLNKMDDLQNLLGLFIEGNEEYSLEEVILTIKEANEKVNQNILKIMNRISLELTIEGFDTEKIDLYIDNNDKIINESSKLIKESLDYMESKDIIENNTVGIETLRKTIQSLKILNQNKIE